MTNKIYSKLNICTCLLLIFGILFSFQGCDAIELPDIETTTYINDNDEVIDAFESIINDTIEDLSDDTTANFENTVIEEDILPSITEEDLVPFDIENPFSYCEASTCLYNNETGMIDFSINFSSIPKSDDFYIYLYEFENYEDDNCFEKKQFIANTKKDSSVTLSFPYETKHLFSKFVPAIAYEGNYYPLSVGKYITNPEAIAKNNTPYPEISSKKGLLLDPLTIDKDELNNLNVKRVVFNIPLSYIMSESENIDIPTINYGYNGKIYHFNGYLLGGFDMVFRYLTANDYHVTAIILNDWNNTYPEIIHPLSRRKTSSSMYYAFNTEEKDGVRAMEAAALFLADRYSGTRYGLIHDWVIANEINQQKIWNYMHTDDVNLYVNSFEQSFRTFYNAIKSRYSNSRVYFSIDQDWNNNNGLNYQYFNGKDIVDSFNEIAKSGGNYDWGLSIHPYPSPLTYTRFWNGYSNKSEDARIVTPMNLSVVTDYMAKDELLDTNGNVRKISVTELGFSSKSGEKIQAAAFAYCYHIINNNEYIDSFLMNRQTDTYDSLKSGLALGIYNPDYSPKYIADIFSKIDTADGEEYLSEMLEIIGASNLEEALSWAN